MTFEKGKSGNPSGTGGKRLASGYDPRRHVQPSLDFPRNLDDVLVGRSDAILDRLWAVFMDDKTAAQTVTRLGTWMLDRGHGRLAEADKGVIRPLDKQSYKDVLQDIAESEPEAIPYIEGDKESRDIGLVTGA